MPDPAPLTPEEILAIAARNAVRTPGAWEWPTDHCDAFTVVAWSDVTEGEPYDIDVEGPEDEVAMANAAFIAGASVDIPRLLATVAARDTEIARLQSDLDRARSIIQQLHDGEPVTNYSIPGREAT